MTYPTFPTLAGLEFPVKRAPKAKTLRQDAVSGRSTFQPVWSAPLYDIEVSFSGLNVGAARGGFASAEWQAMEDFWKTVMFASPGGIFKFNDPNDNAVSGQGFATGDGATRTFQLLRTLSSFAEPVLDPICGPTTPDTTLDYGNCTVGVTQSLDYGSCTVAPAAWLDYGYAATMQVFAGAYATAPTTPLAPWAFVNGTADASGGQVTITPAPALNQALTWTGGFNWLCRFLADTMELSNIFYQMFSLQKLTFETVRL
jgi:hypothetical protein